MRAWLRPILDRLFVGLVPVDGDSGRSEGADQDVDPCPMVRPRSTVSRPRSDEAAWIPSTILFGPPL
jgi:hypothetical protein